MKVTRLVGSLVLLAALVVSIGSCSRKPAPLTTEPDFSGVVTLIEPGSAQGVLGRIHAEWDTGEFVDKYVVAVTDVEPALVHEHPPSQQGGRSWKVAEGGNQAAAETEERVDGKDDRPGSLVHADLHTEKAIRDFSYGGAARWIHDAVSRSYVAETSCVQSTSESSGDDSE